MSLYIDLRFADGNIVTFEIESPGFSPRLGDRYVVASWDLALAGEVGEVVDADAYPPMATGTRHYVAQYDAAARQLLITSVVTYY